MNARSAQALASVKDNTAILLPSHRQGARTRNRVACAEAAEFAPVAPGERQRALVRSDSGGGEPLTYRPFLLKVPLRQVVNGDQEARLFGGETAFSGQAGERLAVPS